MTQKNVVFLGQRKASEYQEFFGRFLGAVHKQDRIGHYEFKCCRTDVEVLSNFGNPYLPQIIFLDAETYFDTLASLYQISDTLKKLDPNGFIVLIHADLKGGSSLSRALDHGISAMLKWNFEAATDFEMLLEAIEMRLDLPPRRMRVPAQHKIKISIASIEQAIVSETLNLGTGGMFVRSLPQNVQTGDNVMFELHLGGDLSNSENSATQSNPLDLIDEEKQKDLLRGSGSVVWVRPFASQAMPEGMGIQFSELDPDTRETIEDYVRHHKIQSFIPKS